MAKNKNSNKQMEVKQNSNVKLNDVKPAKKKEKKPEKVKRNRAKETISELKKVSWPTAKKTASMFGIVVVVVLFFLVVISAFDYGIMSLVKLLMDHSVV